MRRSAMKPGQMFAVRQLTSWGGWSVDRHDLLVVVDAKTEVDFWTGVEWRCGDICPGSHFEVVA